MLHLGAPALLTLTAPTVQAGGVCKRQEHKCGHSAERSHTLNCHLLHPIIDYLQDKPNTALLCLTAGPNHSMGGGGGKVGITAFIDNDILIHLHFPLCMLM